MVRAHGPLKSAVVSVCLAGCGAPPPPAPPPAQVEVERGTTVRPSVAGPGAYPGPALPPRADGFGKATEALGRRAAQRVGVAAPTLDGRLSAAADTLAAAVEGGRPPPLAAVAFAQSHHGLISPIPVVLTAQGSASRPAAELVAPLAPVLADALRRTGANRIGVGVHRRGEAVTLTVLLQARLATLSALLPRALPVDGAGVVQGEVIKGLGAATVHVTDAAGRAQPLETDATGRRFKARFQCSAAGVHRVEVMADGPSGPVVAVNVPVWCGEAPPARLELAAAPAGERDPGRAGRRLFELANGERAKQGLAPLAWDDRLAAVAKAHSGDMAAHGFVAHRSPRSGTPGARVRAAGMQAEAVMENVGLGPDAQAVHAGLMASPAHRSAILAPRMARVGVGVVGATDKLGQTQLYTTQVFVQPLQALDQAQGLRRLQEAAAGAGLSPDAALDAVAQAAAARLAAEGLDARTVNAYVVTRLKAGPRPPLRSLKTLVGQGRRPESLLDGQRGDLSGAGVAVCRDAQDVPIYCSVLLVGTSPRPGD